MPAFFISALFGVMEMYFLSRILRAVIAGNQKKMLAFMLLKFLTYGIVIGLFVLKYFDYYLYCFCGFAVGMPVSAVAFFVYNTFIKERR